MDCKDIQSKIQEFLTKRLKNFDLGEDVDYFALGLVNSLFAMQLVLFVEREFQIMVEEEDLRIENFNTIRALTNFVQQKLMQTVVNG
jgi:methoxymalonate biosynthesis acyl carrier protein